MTTQSPTTTPTAAAEPQKSKLPLLGVTVLTALAVLALVLWQRADQSDPPAPAPALVAAAPAPAARPITIYLVETAEEAAALAALLHEGESTLVAGTAEEQQRAYAHLELMQMNVSDRVVSVIDRRS